MHPIRSRHFFNATCCLPCRYYDPKLWTAFLGLHDQRELSDNKIQRRSIKRIISHPSFNDYTYDYDIAVLELDSPVSFTKEIQPICLPDASHEFPAGKEIWVTGWGATQELGKGTEMNRQEVNRVALGRIRPPVWWEEDTCV